MASLPPLAAFPSSAWRQHLKDGEWDALLSAWVTLCRAYAALDDEQLRRSLKKDDSVTTFLTTFMEETATDSTMILGQHAANLSRAVLTLTTRALTIALPAQLLTFDFIANLSRLYPKRIASPILTRLFTDEKAGLKLEASLSTLKKLLIPHLDTGIRGDLKLVEQRLARLNPLLHASPHACSVTLAGSDFLDSLIAGFKVMNPPLRKVIVTTLYLCLVGLVEAEPPRWSMLSDELYALRMAADTHKQGPLNVNDSLVPELVTSTPILKVLLRRAEASDAASENLKKRITALEGFKKGPMVRPKRLIKRKVDKGKGVASQDEAHAEIHIHKMSKITQVQDVLGDLNLGAGFIAKCLDEYDDDVAQVIDNLLGDSLPPHLAEADRHEPLSLSEEPEKPKDIAPGSTPPSQIPERRNAFDDDEFDKLTMDVSKVSFGKRPDRSADELLKEKTSAPGKAAILSALAAFDSDDDERDDTYDAADVGGTVDSSNQEADAMRDGNEEILFRAYQTNPKVFSRDAEIRRSVQRSKLKQETGMADEALEGWAIMLQRSPQQQRKLEEKFAFKGEQQQIDRSSWRASPAGSGMEESDTDAGRGGARGGRGRGRGRGGAGRGRGGGNVDGPTGEKGTESARRNKEANKGSRANHNRREGRARKMARGGFPG